MKRLVLLAVLLALPAGSAHGDGCPPSQCGMFSSAVPGSRFLHVRTNGERGPLRIYDVVARRQVAVLRAGMMSADRSRFVSAHSMRQAPTYLSTHGLPSGERLSWRKLPGRFGLAGVSRTGARVVLTTASTAGTTTFAVVDRGRVVRTVRLPGSYELDKRLVVFGGDGRTGTLDAATGRRVG